MSNKVLNIKGEDMLVSYTNDRGIIKIFSIQDIKDKSFWVENKLGDFIHSGDKGYILVRHTSILKELGGEKVCTI